MRHPQGGGLRGPVEIRQMRAEFAKTRLQSPLCVCAHFHLTNSSSITNRYLTHSLIFFKSYNTPHRRSLATLLEVAKALSRPPLPAAFRSVNKKLAAMALWTAVLLLGVAALEQDGFRWVARGGFNPRKTYKLQTNSNLGWGS